MLIYIKFTLIMQKTVLITAVNRGLGLEFTKQYLAKDYCVIGTYREKSKELKELEDSYRKKLYLYYLDLLDFKAINSLSRSLGNKKIDLLINNAGFYGGKFQDLNNLDFKSWNVTIQTNLFAPFQIVQAFLENLRNSNSDQKAIINISSKMGSIDDNKSGGVYIYRSSKAALNSITQSLALDLFPEKIKVLSLHPGWVKTEMGGFNALISTEESVKGLINVINNAELLPRAQFLDYTGKVINW